MRSLTKDQFARYRKDGYVSPVEALSDGEADHFRGRFMATRQALGAGATTADIRHPQLFFRWAYEIATSPKILDAVASVVGDDILLTRGAVFFKEPGDRVAHPLHQDAYCLGFDRDHADLFVTAWIALTPSTKANGCVRFYPGTQYRRFSYSAPDSPSRVRNAFITDRLDPKDEVAVEIPTGAMSLHHANVVHHSGTNETDETRIGVVMRYAATCVRQRAPIKQAALLVRGSDRHGLYPLATPPVEDIEGGLARMRRFVDLHRSRAVAAALMPRDLSSSTPPVPGHAI
jgi:hypothetical protein